MKAKIVSLNMQMDDRGYELGDTVTIFDLEPCRAEERNRCSVSTCPKFTCKILDSRFPLFGTSRSCGYRFEIASLENYGEDD